MIKPKFTFDTDDFQRQFRELVMDEKEKAALLLEQAGIETVAFLRSLTDEMRPPARPGEPPRQAHPGGWADISGNLALAYGYQVWRGEESVTLVLYNSMEYAASLEARDGYYVLSGVTDPGGPLEQALRRVIPPEWEIRS